MRAGHPVYAPRWLTVSVWFNFSKNLVSAYNGTRFLETTRVLHVTSLFMETFYPASLVVFLDVMSSHCVLLGSILHVGLGSLDLL